MPRFTPRWLRFTRPHFGVSGVCPAELCPVVLDKDGIVIGTSLPVMLADACAPGDNPDVDQVEVPEAAQPCIPGDGDVEGAAQLDGPAHAARGGGLVGGVNGVGNVICPVNLGAEVLEQGLRLPVGAAGELDLLHHLVGAVVELLLGGDDAEQIDDEGQQQDSDEDEYHRAEVVGFSAVVLQLLFHIGYFYVKKCFFL